MKLTGTISKIGRAKVLVAGDLMLDKYTIGHAKRISPEAPVPVVQVAEESVLPGGAGNVVLNILSLGCDVTILGRVGDDDSGVSIKNILSSEGCDISAIFCQAGYQTPLKHRVIANNQQMVRVDTETLKPISEELEDRIVDSFPQIFQGVKVLAISDYGKGFLTPSLLAALIEYSKEHGITVIVDPKGVDFCRYAGADLIKPNLSEAYAAAGLDESCSLDQVAERIFEISNIETLMITRSEKGITIFEKNGEQQDYPVRVREVKDVTGAGDTVLATLSVALANGVSLSEAAQLSNVTAGIAIEKLGCARVSLTQLARRLLSFDLSNKVFDEDHLQALETALLGKDYVVIAISGDQGLTTEIYRSILDLSHHGSRDVVVYIKDEDPCRDFVSIIASLKEVDFIVLKQESLQHLCRLIKPLETYSLESGQLLALSP